MIELSHIDVLAFKSSLKLFVSLLLQKLSVLQTLDQLELLLLHARHDLLVVKPFLILVHDLVLKILSGLCTSLCLTIATLLLCLSLLVPDHLLDLCSPEDFLLSLQLEHLFVLSFLSFVHGHFFLHFLEVLFPSSSDCLVLSVTHFLIVLNPHVLLMSLLINSFLFLALVIPITLAHLDNVVGPFLGLIDLLPRLGLFIL